MSNDFDYIDGTITGATIKYLKRIPNYKFVPEKEMVLSNLITNMENQLSIKQTTKKFHAFISYSHKDKSYATAIQKSIETMGIPFHKSWRSDVKIFRDERKIPLSGNLTEEILSSLKESKYLLVIASKNSANSTWVKKEILNWYKLNQDENGFINNLAFILTDEFIVWDYLNNDFDKLKSTALPSFDKKMFKELPLWANLQLNCTGGKIYSNNTSYAWEIAKIKGLLLGKKPDEILDEGSKKKRLFRIVISIIILFVLFFIGYLNYQKNTSYYELSSEYDDKLFNEYMRRDIVRHEAYVQSQTIIKLEDKIIADSILKIKLNISLKNQKNNYQAELKKQSNNSKEYLKNYIMQYKEFKKEQLNYSNKFIFSTTVYFDLNNYNVRQKEVPNLSKTLNVLHKFPNSIIFIEAYQLDDEFDKSYFGYDYGLRLSNKRAEATKGWLVRNGIDSNKIKINGTVQYLKSREVENDVVKQLYKKADILIYDDIKN